MDCSNFEIPEIEELDIVDLKNSTLPNDRSGEFKICQGERLKAIVNIKNGKLNGKSYEYNIETGEIEYELNWINGKSEGRQIEYRENSKEIYECVNDKREGADITYYSNGKVKENAYYHNDELNGLYHTFYSSGLTESLGRYSVGKRIGKWISYDEKGDTLELATFNNDSLVEYLVRDDADNLAAAVYKTVETDDGVEKGFYFEQDDNIIKIPFTPLSWQIELDIALDEIKNMDFTEMTKDELKELVK